MEEGAFFSEWTAREVDLEIQMILADIQSYLAQKKSEWNILSAQSSWRQDVVYQTRNWSQELLRKAGFIEDERH